MFRRFKEEIHDWAYDTKANNERTLAVINQVLEPVSNVTTLWQQNHSYITNQEKMFSYSSNFYAFGDATKLLDDFNPDLLKFRIAQYIQNGEDLEQAQYHVIIDYIQQYGLTIEKSKLKLFWDLLSEYGRLQEISQHIKRSIVSDNYAIIFGKCKLINIIRRQNGYYKTVIGSYDDVNKILGENGIKLKEKDKRALKYVFDLEDLEENLNIKKTNIELDQSNRRK